MSSTLPLATIQNLLRQIAALLIYQDVLQSEVGKAFIALLQEFTQSNNALNCLRAYGRFFYLLAATDQSWQGYLLQRILCSDNPFSVQVQRVHPRDLSPSLVAAARHDLQILQQLYGYSGQQIGQWAQAAGDRTTEMPWYESSHEYQRGRVDPPPYLNPATPWAEALDLLATHYRRSGTGLLAEHHVFRWQAGQLVGVLSPDPIHLDDLVGYDHLRQQLVKNTEFLLAGYPALNVLLYGSRGSGKSSMVKGLVNRYRDRGLRLVEVAKADLVDLPEIAEHLRPLAQKFILFVDDLSFEEDEASFTALKVLLEGNVIARPTNVVVYATSNRCHLVREFFADRPRPRDGDDIHAWDTVQEKLSFSDRFGLTLTFEPADQATYLQIVRGLADQAAISLNDKVLEFYALQWATQHNGRSGRTARQFIDFLKADLALNGLQSYILPDYRT